MGFKLFGLCFILWDRLGPWRCLGVTYEGRWFLGFSKATPTKEGA